MVVGKVTLTECVTACPETHDSERVCRTCAEMAKISTDAGAQKTTIWSVHEQKCVEKCGLY